MEEKINIAEILANCPKGIKLWSSAFGQCKLFNVELTINTPINIEVSNDVHYFLLKDTRICEDGEPILFPSKKMRDWNKFAWKKGDVLVDNINDILCVFDGWRDDKYKTFTAKFIYSSKTWYDTSWFYTNNFVKFSDSEAFINKIEKQYGSKLNLSTLEIEKAEEKKQWLFDNLAKKEKQENTEKKTVVLSKEEKKYEFQPMDLCLMRVCYSAWNLCQYAYYSKDINMFVAVGGSAWAECIPYNDQTKHLLGTTNDWKEGERYGRIKVYTKEAWA